MGLPVNEAETQRSLAWTAKNTGSEFEGEGGATLHSLPAGGFTHAAGNPRSVPRRRQHQVQPGRCLITPEAYDCPLPWCGCPSFGQPPRHGSAIDFNKDFTGPGVEKTRRRPLKDNAANGFLAIELPRFAEAADEFNADLSGLDGTLQV